MSAMARADIMADEETPPDELLLELVKTRLHDDWLTSLGDGSEDNRLQDWHTANPPTPEAAARNLMRYRYSNAKMLAQAGNVEPLRKILMQLTGDPGIAKFITAPPAPPRPKYARKASNPFWSKYAERRQQVEKLRRIRQIIQQEIGKTRDTQKRVIQIAAKVMKCSMREIQELTKRGR